MNKTICVAAQRIVKKGLEKVPDNNVNRSIQALCKVGRLSGRQLVLQPTERLKIDRFFSEHLGYPLREIDFSIDTREKMSEQLVEEKYAGGTVFGGLINMATFESALPLKGGVDVFTPGGVVTSAPYDLVDIAGIKKVVIVENGEAILLWDKMRSILPAEFRDAVFIYRGNGENQRLIKHLISQLTVDTEVAMFMDFDAAGLALAEQMLDGRAGYYLYPDGDGASLESHSKKSAYGAQLAILTKLLENRDAGVKNVANVIRESRIAIMQERMLAYRLPLTCVRIGC